MVHNSLKSIVVEVGNVSARVTYLVLKITEKYVLKVILVYAPMSTHPDYDVESMCEDIVRAMYISYQIFLYRYDEWLQH